MKSQKRKRMFILYLAFGYGILYTLTILIGSVVAGAIAFNFKHRKSLFWGLICGALLRILVVLTLGIILLAHPTLIPYFEQRDVARVLLFGSDIGSVYEGVVALHTSKSGFDPFTSMPYRSQGGVTYSVGPSGVDVGPTILYDPTNGLTSQGSIILYVEDR